MTRSISVGKSLSTEATVDEVISALSPLRGKVSNRSAEVVTLTAGNVAIYRFFGAYTKIGRRNLPIEIAVASSPDSSAVSVSVGLRHIVSITPRLEAEYKALIERAAAIDGLLSAA